MMIAAAHHLAFVLENLNMVDSRLGEFLILLSPEIDDFSDLRHLHLRQGQIDAAAPQR